MEELKSKLRIKFGKHIFVSVLTLSITPNLFTSTQTQQEFVYKIPEKLDDGWQVSSLKKEGMDEVMITELTNQIIQGKYKGIHSMLIVKSGNPVFYLIISSILLLFGIINLIQRRWVR